MRSGWHNALTFKRIEPEMIDFTARESLHLTRLNISGSTLIPRLIILKTLTVVAREITRVGIKNGESNFSEFMVIRQSFPPPMFPSIRYA